MNKKMNKIAVNPTQFITCRLCLEELGNYQIVPSVKEQIKYCFDIEVEPFDGLPQLICQKCEVILSSYADIKNKFVEKQNELRGKVFNAQGTHYGQLSDAQQPQPEKNSKSQKGKLSSSSDEEYNIKKITSKRIKLNNNTYEKEHISWQNTYTKQYVCKFCSSHWTNINSLKNHVSNRHRTLSKKYSNTLKRHCQVNLNKCDDKPNLTGSSRQVVLANEKIVENVNSDYHIIYTTRYYRRNKTSNVSDTNVRNKKSKSRIKNIPYSSSDSSDEEIVGKRKRIRRISSKSSNDTLILHDKSNQNSDSDNSSRKVDTINSPGACIDLDGSSESESKEGIKKSGMQVLNNNDSTVKQATVNEIINSCRNKYIKKYYQDTISTKNPSEIANKLQHKILSIGRKIINKRVGVNCTPLLRFLEHKNLDVTWLNRDILSVSQDSNHIRIISRRKNALEKTDCNETGWIDYISSRNESFASFATNNSSDPEQTNQTNMCNGISVLEGPTATDSLVTSDGHLVGLEIKKLLNANPVANPKQLPKKFASNEVKIPNVIVKAVDYIPQECMPIITSTTSLAPPSKDDSGDANRSEIDSTTDKQPEVPRIKVKPVSELMSAETLNRMQNPVQLQMQSPVQPHLQSPIHIPINIIGKGIPLSVQNITVPTMPHIVSSHSLLRRNNDMVSAQPAPQTDYLILDTVEMPNMKTNAPYLYVKKLLQMHNIILLDTLEEVPTNFHCLLKFKVLYKQDSQQDPVTLCLSLYCSKNVFCFNIKNRNNENIDFTKLACNWQWEVLKMYKGEVVDKLLHNAQKIGQDVYDFTNSLLCLLKSITVKSKP